KYSNTPHQSHLFVHDCLNFRSVKKIMSQLCAVAKKKNRSWRAKGGFFWRMSARKACPEGTEGTKP
ncbi:MAG: hypothetical protein AAF804_17105, partial [Bacteroidota bacterium]